MEKITILRVMVFYREGATGNSRPFWRKAEPRPGGLSRPSRGPFWVADAQRKASGALAGSMREVSASAGGAPAERQWKVGGATVETQRIEGYP